MGAKIRVEGFRDADNRDDGVDQPQDRKRGAEMNRYDGRGVGGFL